MLNKVLFMLLALCAITVCHCQKEADVVSSGDVDSSVNTSTILSSTVAVTTEKPQNVSCESYNKQCKECVAHKSCYYCQTDEKCNKYQAKEIIPSEECSVDSIRYLTCSISFKILMILIGTLSGIVLLVIVCVCCYCCCKRKGIKISKDEIKFARQREERKARAEERKKERATRTDEIRRKYGLMKDDNPYERFDA